MAASATAPKWKTPTTGEQPLNYYGEEAAIGQALSFYANKPNARVGVVGMGTGTVGCYAKAGHTYRFYEINPEIPRLAEKYFTYLADMRARGAKAEVLLGDARLVMEREEPQKLDVIILDAFSGDSIPVHLLTAEAMQIYARHLNPDGMLIVHMTNRYVRLAPVARNAAELLGLKTVRMTTEESDLYDITDAMILTNNEAFLKQAVATPPEDEHLDSVIPLWTDGRSDLFSILQKE
jgi:SAM-dependent methyltransferase